MKSESTTKTTVKAFIQFFMLAGIYTGVIVLVKTILERNGMSSPAVNYTLGFILGFGFGFICRHLYRRLKTISHQP
ncbi:MAG: hypothetical protein K2M98_06345 [Muribaculum sp.]|nr:hypothetical protein [Muribaculum sp.]